MAENTKKLKRSKFQVYSSNGQFRWRLYSRNGKILASGEGFVTKKSCLHSIDVIRNQAAEAEIDDRTVLPDRSTALTGGTPHRKKWSGNDK